jgi:hypothetical protein
MSAWSLAVGNLANLPRTPVLIKRKRIRAADDRPVCPHCGARMKNPDGPKAWTTEEDATLMEMLDAGSTPKAIAGQLKRPASSIYSRIVTLNLPRRTWQRRSS